jgi:hypothetical protein
MRTLPILIGYLMLLVGLSLAQEASAIAITSGPSSSFDAMECTMTITWTTDEYGTSVVRWDTGSCLSVPPYEHTEYGPSGTYHSVTFDVTDTPNKLSYQVESSTDGDTVTSGCNVAKKTYCISQ